MPNKEFEETIMKMLTKLEKNFNKELYSIIKNQADLKNTAMKNTLEKIINRLANNRPAVTWKTD